MMKNFFGRGFILIIFTILFSFSFVFGQNSEFQTLLDEIDELNDANEFDAAMTKLQKAEKIDKDNPEFLWRMARNYFQFADQNPEDLELQKKNLYPGFKYAERCLKSAPKVAGGHQYYAILIGRIGELEGTKQKITNSFKVKEHTMIAIGLEPENDSNYHVMGRWHFVLADLNWFERNIAELIYGDVPEASFNESVKFFSKAHELKPDEIRHLLWLGKAYLKLDKDSLAENSLKNAVKITPDSDSDIGMVKEAKELLKDF